MARSSAGLISLQCATRTECSGPSSFSFQKVLAGAELSLERARPDDPGREDLVAVRDAGRSAAALTRQLLAFSRKQGLELQPLQLDDFVRAFTPMLRRLLGEDVAIRVEIDVGLPPVLGDAGSSSRSS